jgi:hypothetical protein
MRKCGCCGLCRGGDEGRKAGGGFTAFGDDDFALTRASSLSDLEAEALSWLGGSREKAAAMPTSCYNFRCAEERRSIFAWDREFQYQWDFLESCD